MILAARPARASARISSALAMSRSLVATSSSFCEIGLTIKKQSPFSVTLMSGYTNGRHGLLYGHRRGMAQGRLRSGKFPLRSIRCRNLAIRNHSHLAFATEKRTLNLCSSKISPGPKSKSLSRLPKSFCSRSALLNNTARICSLTNGHRHRHRRRPRRRKKRPAANPLPARRFGLGHSTLPPYPVFSGQR